MIVFSFAWRSGGDSPCNVRLAEAARRIAEAQPEAVTIVAQRSVARSLSLIGIPCRTITKKPGYEGSEEVAQQAAEIFTKLGITQVIVVAQPVFQIVKCYHLVHRHGLSQPSLWRLITWIGWIGFDPYSAQPWTRSWWRFTVATFRQGLFGYRPPAEYSEP